MTTMTCILWGGWLCTSFSFLLAESLYQGTKAIVSISGAPLVKGIPFDPTDPEISGADIFQKLVPMEAHEASSVYR